MSREADGTKKRRIAHGRFYSFGVLLVLAFMLMWSNVAVCGEIHKAIKDNDSAKVRELIKNNPDLVFSKDEDGFTPLHLAAANGNKDLVRFLLTTTKAEVNARDNAGSTPMHQAATAKGHSDIVELLLMHGAEVNAQDKQGLTPLHYATLVNNPDAVKTLLDHAANANARDNHVGDTPLIMAVAKGYEVVKLLLENGANVYRYPLVLSLLSRQRLKGSIYQPEDRDSCRYTSEFPKEPWRPGQSPRSRPCLCHN
jgi:hypothetical protein